MSEYDANRRLSETARLRVLDVVHGEIRRERRRKVRTPAPATPPSTPEQVEANEQAIEGGVWPVYTP